jgi:hypothetical protein
MTKQKLNAETRRRKEEKMKVIPKIFAAFASSRLGVEFLNV